jgi:hypothetical protein
MMTYANEQEQKMKYILWLNVEFECVLKTIKNKKPTDSNGTDMELIKYVSCKATMIDR